MSSIEQKPRRRRLPEGERREQILRAAFAVAARRGVGAVTARSVAAAAGLSQGLVFFHFRSTAKLLAALVAHVTESTLAVMPSSAAYDGVAPRRRLGAFLVDRLGGLDARRDGRVVELLVEAWVVGLREPAARKSVRDAAARYREAFLPLAEAAVADSPERFAGATPEAVATLALSIVLGTAIQETMDPQLFGPRGLAPALLGLLGTGDGVPPEGREKGRRGRRRSRA